MKVPLIRYDNPMKPIDTNGVMNDPAKTNLDKAKELLADGYIYLYNDNLTEADKTFKMAETCARQISTRGMNAANRKKITDLITEITNGMRPKDTDRAEGLMNNANLYRSAGYYPEAKKLYDLALSFAEKSKDQKMISQILLEMGRFYYYKTGNISMAIYCFDRVINNPGSRAEDVINAQRDKDDIESFRFSQVNASQSFQKDSSGSRSETVVNGNYRVGGLEVGVTCKSTNFLGTRDITAPFVTSASIAADPLMPDSLKNLLNHQFPIFQIKGANSLNLKLNYSIPLFDGPITAPWRIYEVFPVVGVGYGIKYTSVDATVYRNYRYLDSIETYQGEQKDVQLRTVKHTIPISLEMGSFIFNPNRYAYSWQLTPYGIAEISSLSANRKGVYNLMEGTDQSKPGNVGSTSFKYGIRMSTPRYTGLPFLSQVKDDAGRYNVDIFYQTGRDSTVNSEDGIWTVSNTRIPKVSSLNFGIGREFVSQSLGLIIPVSLQYGLTGLGNSEKNAKTGYYIGSNIGVRKNNWEINLGYAHSSNGNSFKADTLSLSFGKRF